MLLNCSVREDSWESLGLHGVPTSPSKTRSVLNVHWKDWCWNWNSNTLATWCEELTHLKRPWCWKRLKAGGEGDNRGWDCWMASLTWWTCIWVGSGSWWWTGKPGVLRSMGLQRVRHNWATELNWTDSWLWWIQLLINLVVQDRSKCILASLFSVIFWILSIWELLLFYILANSKIRALFSIFTVFSP